MDDREKRAGSGEGIAGTGLDWLGVAQIVVANAVPVVGVWVLGWQAERAIFFYWLDGLLAMWGLGVVAVIVTGRDGPAGFDAKGPKLWLTRFAVVALVLVFLSLPSVIAGAMVLGSLGRDLWEVLRAVLAGSGIWISLAVVVGSYAWQTISEVRWKPELTLKTSGEERANLFIHRIILMGMLVFWSRSSQPSRWALAVYVLIVACLFTYTQLYQDRYLELIGFRKKTPQAG